MAEKERKPQHGEIRLTNLERLPDSFRVTYTLYMDKRVVYRNLRHYVASAPRRLQTHAQRNTNVIVRNAAAMALAESATSD